MEAVTVPLLADKGRVGMDVMSNLYSHTMTRDDNECFAS